MGQTVRRSAFLSLLLLVIAACGSRVVPLDFSAIGPGGQPLGNPTGGNPTLGPSANPTGTGGFTGGGGGTGSGSGSGPLANCVAPAKSTDKGVSKDTIKVGLVAAINGSFRGQFNASIEAVDAYFKMINADEGGVCGRKLQLFIRDDAGNAGQDRTAARELADDIGVFAFVGSISAPDSDTGVAEVSKAQKIPDIGFPLTYLRSESPYSYGVPGQLQKRLIGDGATGSRYLNQLYGVKQIALFWVGEALVSKANAYGFEAAMLKTTNNGIKVCYERETSVLDNNFDPYASALKQHCPVSGGPLAVFTTMENNSNIKLAASMKGQSVKYAYFSPTFTSYLPSFLRDDAGNPRPETEGAYIAIPQIPFERCSSLDSKSRPLPPCNHPELDRYMRALRRFVPNFKAPGSWGGPGWGEAALFVQTLKMCGAQLTRACVVDKLNQIKSFTANGLLTPTTPGDHVIYKADLLLQVRNGRFVEVRPTDKSGPSGAPDFWDQSVLIDWWDYFCHNKSQFPSRDDIDAFVTSC